MKHLCTFIILLSCSITAVYSQGKRAKDCTSSCSKWLVSITHGVGCNSSGTKFVVQNNTSNSQQFRLYYELSDHTWRASGIIDSIEPQKFESFNPCDATGNYVIYYGD